MDIELDFFEREGQVYYRSSEQFQERAYSTEQLAQMLTNAGLEMVAVYEEMTFSAPKDDSQRLVFCDKKDCISQDAARCWRVPKRAVCFLRWIQTERSDLWISGFMKI